MKLFIVSWGFDPERQGGIARFCIELALGMRSQGVDVELWGVLAQDTARERQERQRLETLGVRTRIVPPQRGEAQTTLTAVLMIVHSVRQELPDYVSVHGALAELCGLAIMASTRVSVIRSVHSEREWYKRPGLGVLVDQMYAQRGSGEIGVSSRITEVINRRRLQAGAQPPARWIPPISNARVVEQAYELTRFEARRRLDIPSHAYVVGSIGRFTPQKGYDTLVDASALLRDRGHDLQMYIVGEGPLEAQLQEQIERLSLTDRVHLLPPRAEVGHFLRALDLFVSCSRWEGMSLSVQEATLCGLPVVCTDVSGTDDLQRVLDRPLLVCPPDDPAALAQQIVIAKQGMGDEGQAISHGSSVAAHGQIFTPESIAQAYMKYFETTYCNP